MRIDIISGSNPPSSARSVVPVAVDWPSGAEVKRRLSMLEEGHAKFREDLGVFWNTWQQLTNQVNSITVVKGERGEKGDKGDKGDVGLSESKIIVAELPAFKQGWWYRFCRRWLLGI